MSEIFSRLTSRELKQVSRLFLSDKTRADLIRLTTAQISGAASTDFNDNLQSKETSLMTFYSLFFFFFFTLLDRWMLHTHIDMLY